MINAFVSASEYYCNQIDCAILNFPYCDIPGVAFVKMTVVIGAFLSLKLALVLPFLLYWPFCLQFCPQNRKRIKNFFREF